MQMSFKSYKPFKTKNLFTKYTIMFLLGISFVLFFTNAFNITTNIENASQYIKQIILTDDGSTKWTTWVVIDWNTSGGRIWANRYCTLDFSKCISIKSIVTTWDVVWFLTGAHLDNFKEDEVDPLSWKIIALSWALSNYAQLTELDNYAPLSELSKYAELTALAWYATTGQAAALAAEIARIDRNIEAMAAASCEGWWICSMTGDLEKM